ncbi:Kinase-like protein [Mycena kentingensis (nom. inval.)]|nr:Kinase-like protein [Mycena kentingensis (nom. inval.)]
MPTLNHNSGPTKRTVVRSSVLDQLYLQARLAWGGILYGEYESLTRISRTLCVKSHFSTKLSEALTLEYIAAHTTIPVPRVHAVYKDRRGYLNMVMDYVPGTELEKIWNALGHEDRLSIVRQLRGFIDQLRALQPPDPRTVQAVGGGPCKDTAISPPDFGPFPSVAAFHSFLGHDYVIKHEFPAGKFPDSRAAFMACTARPYRIMFAHCDIAPRNIIVDGKQIVAIVDWEKAGWYPEYREFTQTFFANSWYPRVFWDLMEQEGFSQKYPEEKSMEVILSTVFIRN